MTTKFLDNKICTFNILFLWRFPRKKKKTAFWTIFLSALSRPPLKKRNFIFTVSPSLNCRRVRGPPVALRLSQQISWGFHV